MNKKSELEPNRPFLFRWGKKCPISLGLYYVTLSPKVSRYRGADSECWVRGVVGRKGESEMVGRVRSQKWRFLNCAGRDYPPESSLPA